MISPHQKEICNTSRKETIRKKSNGKRSRENLILFFGFCFIIAFLYVIFGMKDFCEGYAGLVRFSILPLALLVCAGKAYKTVGNKGLKGYLRCLLFILATVFTSASLFGFTQLVTDLAGNRLKTYEEPFRVKESRHRGKGGGGTDYYITWKGDYTSAWSGHAINTEHFYSLSAYSTVRITYWENTGVVKSIEPKKKKMAGE